MRLPSVSKKHHVSVNPRIEVQRSVFDLSHGHKTTFDAGKLIPVMCLDVIPGDTLSIDATMFARLATPIYPLMDNMKMDIHFFFVPDRILWTNFVKMMGEQTNPGDSIAYMTPIVTVNAGAGVGFTAGSLYDYLGIPTEVDDISVNNLPARAYNQIYNEWYRDQNIISSITIDLGDGPDTISNYVIRNRAKKQDYFTTCLATPQKGSAVSIPLGTTAPVLGIGTTTNANVGSTASVRESGGTTRTFNDSWIGNSGANSFYLEEAGTTNYPSIYANLAVASSATINELREAFATQQLLERDARGGTRYPEMILSQYGVNSPLGVIQNRPEYLGGGSADLIVTPIAQTAITAGSNALGDLAGMGTFTGRAGFTKSFTEFGWVMAIVSTRGDLTYTQGISRKFARRDRYDYYIPVFAHLGEQAVLKQEIYATETAATNIETFGYQERYAEYRMEHSKATGLFRPNHATTLAAWHLAQEFGSMPSLNQTFIEETPPMTRVIAVTTEPHFIFDSVFKVKAVRPMPLYSVPGLERL
uniref:Capsid protein n=1 Tax=Microviridae sp. ctMIi2 TaxID=2824993 RepID=A0A8S5R2D8_9VIRU|nr:MAG TPA: capsid protein [Microviridae sp. ctMIi2]